MLSTWRSARLRLVVAVVAVAVAPGTAGATTHAAADPPDAPDASLRALPEGAGTLTLHATGATTVPEVCRAPIPVIEPLPDACLSRYPNGTLVTVTAVPDPAVPGARFERWSDYRCADAEPVCVLAMTESRSLTAFFSPVFLKVKPGTFGPVTLTPPGDVCTFMPDAVAGDAEPCLRAYPRGSDVTLTRDAAAEAGTDTEWSGACSGAALTCRLNLVENTYVRAGNPESQRFGSPPGLTLTLNAGSLGGRIRVSQGQPGTCKKKCVVTGFRKGDRVLLTALPSSKVAFTKWENGSKGRRRSIDIGSKTAAKAVFKKKKAKKKKK